MTQITSIRLGVIVMCVAIVPLSLAQTPRTGTSVSNKTAAPTGTVSVPSGLSGSSTVVPRTGTTAPSVPNIGANTNIGTHTGTNAGAQIGARNQASGITAVPSGSPSSNSTVTTQTGANTTANTNTGSHTGTAAATPTNDNIVRREFILSPTPVATPEQSPSPVPTASVTPTPTPTPTPLPSL
jgi:hypothetical protein